MMLTRRQWMMFTLFIIELAYVLFTAARTGDITIISSSLSILLFLGALYLEHNHNSKRILLLAAVWLIVNMVFSLIQIVPVVFTSFSLFTITNLLSHISLYIGVYLFSMKYYKGNFYNLKENLFITVLVIPMVLLVMYSAYLFFSLPINITPLDLLYIIMGYISNIMLSLAIGLYTWLRHKNVN